MVCAHVRSIIPSLKLGDYVSVQAHKPCSISHISAKLKSDFHKQEAPTVQRGYSLSPVWVSDLTQFEYRWCGFQILLSLNIAGVGFRSYAV